MLIAGAVPGVAADTSAASKRIDALLTKGHALDLPLDQVIYSSAKRPITTVADIGQPVLEPYA